MEYLRLLVQVVGYLILFFVGLCVLDIFVALFLVLVRGIIDMFRRKKDDKDN